MCSCLLFIPKNTTFGIKARRAQSSFLVYHMCAKNPIRGTITSCLQGVHELKVGSDAHSVTELGYSNKEYWGMNQHLNH